MYGYVRVCAATVPIKVADVKFNTENIIAGIKQAQKNNCAVEVFPELCVCGYTLGDLFNQQSLLSAVERAIKEICLATKDCKTLVFVGAPIVWEERLFNCAVCICNGKVLGVVPKKYLPDYGEFYERRHFSNALSENCEITVAGFTVPFGTNLIFKAVNQENLTVACEICEDLWAPLSPSISHAKAGANVIVNLSCSDETVGKAEYRRNLVKMQSAKLVCGYVYCDAGDGESTTDCVFAGHNIIAENGSILKESKLFGNGIICLDIDVDLLASERRRTSSVFFNGENAAEYKVIPFEAQEISDTERTFSKTPFVPEKDFSFRAELILSIQSNALKKRISHTGAKTAVIGISGGLDSALAFLVTCRAFEQLNRNLNDVIAVTMPGFGTTGKTKNNSLKLIKTLGATGKTVPISGSVLKHFKDIGHDEEKRDVTYENAQARMRTMILMDIANDTDGLVIGTGDLSELALGWATYNGDHMSMYSVNCSVPKTLVKYLVAYEAERIGGECGKILKDILNTEISPELLPPDKNGKILQKTEDLVGPYVLHDFFLYYFARWGFPPEKIKFIAEKTFDGDYTKAEILKWLTTFYRRFFSQQFKRSCVPDGVKVGSVSLSPRGDWRMPSDAVVKLWLEGLE